MRRRGFVAVIAGAGVALLTACSLLTSIDGLSGGDVPDAGIEAPVAIPDAASDADASAVVDAADAADATDRSALYAAAVLSDNPLGYWRLEETTGTVAKDERGKHDGTYVAGPSLAQPGVAGSRGVKLVKDSNARMRVLSPDFRFPGTAPYTVELWVVPGGFRDYQWLSSTEVVGGGVRSGWSLLTDAQGKVRYEVWTSNGDGGTSQVRGSVSGSLGLTLDRLSHVVMTYSGSDVILYVDGVRGPNLHTTSACPNTGDLWWGCRGDVYHCLDDWTIDELAIYEGALSEARVVAHYELGK